MRPIKVSFVISDLSSDEIEQLKHNYSIVAKMILTPDDYKLFRYGPGDQIQVQTQQGDRLWCRIEDLEKVESEERVILIFTLSRAG